MALGTHGSAQLGHTRRSNRCASTDTTVEEIRNASMFMFSSRSRPPIASSVWNVVSTLWPVRAAWIAVSAEKRSRISPSTITSGSCRTMWRSVSSNVRLILALIEHCAMPSTTYSTGSSAVTMQVSGVLR